MTPEKDTPKRRPAAFQRCFCSLSVPFQEEESKHVNYMGPSEGLNPEKDKFLKSKVSGNNPKKKRCFPQWVETIKVELQKLDGE